jgi:hypothetical protein
MSLTGHRSFALLVMTLSTFVVTHASAFAQTPMSIRNVTKAAAADTKTPEKKAGEAMAVARSAGKSPADVKEAGDTAAKAEEEKARATNNPWFGAQLAQTFGKSTGFETNIVATGQFVYDVPFDRKSPAPSPTPFLEKFHLPVLSNFGGEIGEGAKKEDIQAKTAELLSGGSGLTAGLYPYYVMKQNNNFIFTFHGQLSWKFNSFAPLTAEPSTASDAIPIHQLKTGAGFEMLIGDNTDGAAGVSFSVTFLYTKFMDPASYEKVFGETKTGLAGADTVFIFPVSKGVGLIFEGVAAGANKSSFRVGLILAAQK